MSVFGRLTRILRAQLQAQRPRGDEGPPFGADDPDLATPPEDRRDPVIAGYYANLETPYGSDLETVKKAWKRQLQKYHPDLHSQDAEKRRVALELTQGLNRAYEALKQHLR